MVTTVRVVKQQFCLPSNPWLIFLKKPSDNHKTFQCLFISPKIKPKLPTWSTISSFDPIYLSHLVSYYCPHISTIPAGGASFSSSSLISRNFHVQFPLPRILHFLLLDSSFMSQLRNHLPSEGSPDLVLKIPLNFSQWKVYYSGLKTRFFFFFFAFPLA